jgi:broad specificity phosphatase PhoE
MTERTLIIARHGQTNWNIEERFQGQLDVTLNVTGRHQAGCLRKHLAGTTFDTVYSSPLRRSAETARIIAGQLPIIFDGKLAEIHHGSWQGETKQEIAVRWPDQWSQWQDEPQRFVPSGGETAAQVRSRVEEFLGTIQGTTILCVSHGVVIQTFLSILLGASDRRSPACVPPNGSIHSFWFRGTSVSDYRASEIV